MQSATAVQLMPVQNAARQARWTSTNGTAAGYMKSSCSSSCVALGCAASSRLAVVARGIEFGVFTSADASGAQSDETGGLTRSRGRWGRGGESPAAMAHLQQESCPRGHIK